MDDLATRLTAEDLAFRRAAETYFEEKGKLARSLFDEKNRQNFLSFEDHWRDFFAPSDPQLKREYLATPFEVRQAQFERFKRLCHSWEDTFRHGLKSPGAGGNGSRPEGGNGGNDLKRRLDALKAKEDEVRQLHDRLHSMLDRERRRLSHPAELLGHLRALGMPYDATLEDIKRQYRRLAKINHPDRHGDAAKMIRLSDAYRAILAYYQR